MSDTQPKAPCDGCDGHECIEGDEYVCKYPGAVDSRTCTCHPDDNPPVPCAHKYALADCRAAATKAPGADAVRDSTETMEQLFTRIVASERDQWKLKAETALADRAAIVEALEPFANATIGWIESSFDERQEITLVCDDVNMGGIDVAAFFRAARVLAATRT